MALTDLWQTSPDQLRGKHIHQIIAFAGDGRLRDGNAASGEFRSFLTELPSELLATYAQECLTSSFSESGQALQDIVNQVGERLGFEVTFGRYRGTSGHIGFDGLWRSPTGHSIVIEVKTSDVYRLSLETIADYRRALISAQEITETESSVLIVVGRNDTGDLRLKSEARVMRGTFD